MKILWISLLLQLALPGLINCNEEKYHSTATFKHPVAQAVFNLGYKLLDEWQSTSSEDNGVISPECIYSALALILPGLNGPSQDEVARALGGLHLADIVGEHNEMNKAVFNNQDAHYQAHRANRLYIDNSVLLTKTYKETVFDVLLSQNSHKRVNFQENPDQAREKINKYVENHTNGEIKNFLDSDQVTTMTRMFLVTALSLQAQWEQAFEETRISNFQVTPDITTTATYMVADSASCYLTYNEDQKYMAVRIPFKASEMSMMIIMPWEAGDFSTINQQNVQFALDEVSESDWAQKCELIIPKFKVETDINNMIPMLQKLGISSMFNPDVVDLSNMLQKDTEDIHVTDFTHVASVEIDEKGIKASAATAVGFSARILPRRVEINKPFLFIIRQEATGSTLFIGKISKP